MANWNQSLYVLSGYRSGESDFGACLARAPARDQQAVAALVQRVSTAMQNPGATAVLVVTAHSDRQDRQDMSPDQRRQSELDASMQRVVSAGQWLADQLTALVGPPDASATWPRILTIRNAQGAALLINKTPANEAQRAENRRVELQVYASGMPAFALDFETLPN
jgi:hypothetical protein